jgi:hypothetical protein
LHLKKEEQAHASKERGTGTYLHLKNEEQTHTFI